MVLRLNIFCSSNLCAALPSSTGVCGVVLDFGFRVVGSQETLPKFIFSGVLTGGIIWGSGSRVGLGRKTLKS